MIKYWKLVFISTLFGGCSPPSIEELGHKFFNSPLVYEGLKKMIIADTGDRNCFTVGTDNIDQYWKSSGSWRHRKDSKTKLTLVDVLDATGISEQRYAEYLSLFNKADAERVGYCKDTSYGQWFRVLIYRSGLAVSGCSGTIEWYSEYEPKQYGKRGRGEFIEVLKLNNNWYAFMEREKILWQLN